MTCEELRALLEVEGAAESDAARAHLQGCPGCRREAERWNAARAVLRDMGREPAPPFLHSRIMAHVRSASAAAPVRGWRWSWRGPALAALGAAVVILGLGLFRAARPPAAALEEERAQSAEKLALVAPGGDLDKGGAAAPAVPPPTQAPTGRDDRQANEVQVVRREVPGAANDLALTATTEARKPQDLPLESTAAHPSAGDTVPSVETQAAPAGEGVSRLAVAAGAVGRAGPEAAAAGTLRVAEQKAAAAEFVRCRLELEGDGDALELELPAAEAPSPHEVWSVMVAADGRIEVLDARGRSQQAPAALQRGLAQQQRQQQHRYGRYRLSQAPVQATPAP